MMEKYTIETTILFSIESDVTPQVIAEGFNDAVRAALKNIFTGVHGMPVATRVFDKNGDHITEV